MDNVLKETIYFGGVRDLTMHQITQHRKGWGGAAGVDTSITIYQDKLTELINQTTQHLQNRFILSSQIAQSDHTLYSPNSMD